MEAILLENNERFIKRIFNDGSYKLIHLVAEESDEDVKRVYLYDGESKFYIYEHEWLMFKACIDELLEQGEE